jgi:hypothetical protein
MKARTAYWLVGGAVAGVALVAVSRVATPAEQRITGLPGSRRLTYSAATVNDSFWKFGAVVPLLDGSPVLKTDLQRSRELSSEFHVSAALRRAQLPPDANPKEVDAYSKELYALPSWLALQQAKQLDTEDLRTAINGTPVDEFGRLKPGHYGESDQSLWGQTLGGLMKNRLFAAVATVAVLAAPGGIAIYGAYTLWQMRGKDLTLKNVAMAAGRSYAQSQCGQGCAVAFDMGVGVASGKSADKSAENALVKQMNPQERAQYDAGKNLAREAS